MKDANAAKVSTMAAISTPTNARLRSSARSSIDCSVRVSTTTNATSSTGAATSQSHVSGCDQPCSLARISPYVRLAAAPVKVAMPATSTRPRTGACASSSTRTHNTIASTLTGRLTKKIHRQDTPSVSSPPKIGPTAADAPATAPHIPYATPRSRPL